MSFQGTKTVISKPDSFVGEEKIRGTSDAQARNNWGNLFFNHLWIQPNLTVGPPDDRYEREADAVADQVMRLPEPDFIQRKCTECERKKNFTGSRLGKTSRFCRQKGRTE